MSKVKSEVVDVQTEAFEMIELAVEDLELLTRAFDLIDKACREESTKVTPLPVEGAAEWIH